MMRYKFFHIPAMSPDHAEAELNCFFSQHHVLQTEREGTPVFNVFVPGFEQVIEESP